MEKRNISISLEKAREWYKGRNVTLKHEAYSEEEELKKKTTYSNIIDELWGRGKLTKGQISISGITTSNNVEKIKVLNKLYIIATYFNGDWVPSLGIDNYYIGKGIRTIKIACNNCILSSVPYFKNKEDAQKALEMLSSDELGVLFK